MQLRLSEVSPCGLVGALSLSEPSYRGNSPRERRTVGFYHFSGAILKQRGGRRQRLGHGVRLSLQIHHYRRYRYNTHASRQRHSEQAKAVSAAPAPLRGSAAPLQAACEQCFRSVGVNDVVKGGVK